MREIRVRLFCIVVWMCWMDGHFIIISFALLSNTTQGTRAHECVRSRIRSHLMWISIIIKWWWFRTLLSLYAAPALRRWIFINRMRDDRIFFFSETTFGGFCREKWWYGVRCGTWLNNKIFDVFLLLWSTRVCVWMTLKWCSHQCDQ